ncbi:MAG TPA: hypothetical protein VEG60_00945 [Candidatus Binatia bacterium]|nr:hypothetical protein [Candidatus Binatia bacterium]
MFGVRLGVVVPAWSAGTQVHMDVLRAHPAALDAGNPFRHDGGGAVMPVELVNRSPTGEPLFQR